MSDFENIWAIQQVYFRYCEAIDTKNFALLKEVFAPDALFDHSQAHGPNVVFRGLPVFLERLEKRMGPASNCGPTHHNVGNFRVNISGAIAYTKVQFYAVHRGQNDFAGELYSLWGEYDDDLKLTPEGWRIIARRFLVSLREGPAVTGEPKKAAGKKKIAAKKKAAPKKKAPKVKRRAISRKRPRRK